MLIHIFNNITVIFLIVNFSLVIPNWKSLQGNIPNCMWNFVFFLHHRVEQGRKPIIVGFFSPLTPISKSYRGSKFSTFGFTPIYPQNNNKNTSFLRHSTCLFFNKLIFLWFLHRNKQKNITYFTKHVVFFALLIKFL